jgi:hypothetical protein
LCAAEERGIELHAGDEIEKWLVLLICDPAATTRHEQQQKKKL